MRTLVVLLLFVAATAAHADHDAQPRTNLELGFEASLRGNAPLGGYAFLHWNRPHFAEEDLDLRVDVAPVYLDTELISDGWPWKRLIRRLESCCEAGRRARGAPTAHANLDGSASPCRGGDRLP